MPFFQTHGGVALHYNDWGSGRPVVLIHGWPLTSANWEYQAARLVENGYRVISYDRRGFGRSDQPWTGYDYDTLSDDLHQLIQHLGLRQAVLAGYSMGSGEVVRYLSRQGTDAVSGAMLVSGVVPLLAQSDRNPNGMDRAAFDGLLQALLHDRVKCLSDYAHALFADESLRAWYLNMTYQASDRAIAACAQAWYGTDFYEDLAAVTVPALIVHGAADESAPAAMTGRLASQLIPSAQYVEYADAGHYLLFEHKARVAEDMLNFLNALPSGR